MGWETMIGIVFTAVFSAGVGYGIGFELGKQRAERDQEERIQSRKDAEEAQRQREVEAKRKDAGLPPMYPEARRMVDITDSFIEADERQRKELGSGPRYPEARAKVDAEDAKRDALNDGSRAESPLWSIR